MAASSGTRRGNGGMGVGWGGPANGPGSSAPSFVDSLENRIGGVAPLDPQVRQSKAEREARRLEQAEAVKDEIYRIATKGVREADRVNAGVAFLNRVEGMPVARNLNLNGELFDLTDDELRDELDRLAAGSGAVPGDPPGIAPAPGAAGPADVGD